MIFVTAIFGVLMIVGIAAMVLSYICLFGLPLRTPFEYIRWRWAMRAQKQEIAGIPECEEPTLRLTK